MTEQLIHFGKLSLLYDNGFVRYIRAGQTEIVRNIYFALRDNNWTTAPFKRSDERISVNPKGFEISYTATNVIDNKEIFRWHVRIAGSEEGQVNFMIDGECLAAYNRNRAGICVLHPVRDTRDKELHITRPDGTKYETRFPSLISPHQPFFDIQKMNWRLNGDARAELQFEGDIFETEDQRNWADSSFKTYSTPLSVPYPVMLKPGDKVNQRVRLILVNGDSLPALDFAEDIEVTIDERNPKPFPEIISRDEKRFAHIALNAADDFDKIELPSTITTLAISPVDRKASVDELLKSVLPKARKLFPEAQIGAGFTTYFTELNRNRFDYSGLDFVIYPVTPQAHLSDAHTVIENLPAQRDQVESAKAFVAGKKIYVGPVYLESPIGRLEAGWLLGSIKYLAEGGADCVILPSLDGAEMHALLGLNPRKVIASSCNEPLMITSLVTESGDRKRHVILINHTASKKSVTFQGKLYNLSGYEVQFISLR